MFGAILRGEPIPWPALQMSPEAFLSSCEQQGLSGLVYARTVDRTGGGDWPPSVLDGLADAVRARTAQDLLRRAEVTRVLDGLAAAGLSVVLLKGTPLAYSVYPMPAARPRTDTDFLLPYHQVDRLRQTMAGLGYEAPLFCSGDLLFCQFPLQRTDAFGVVHRFDCHWRISTQSVFADVLTFEEAAARSIPVPALGEYARTLSVADALLLACVHPVMHHRNAQPLLWMFDVHLLAAALSNEEFERFTERAIAKKVSAICAQQLEAAAGTFGSPIPDAVVRKLTAGRGLEPSAAYLERGRGWGSELLDSLRGLPRWRDRLRLLREVAFPATAYIRQSYGFDRQRFGAALLPALYVHRIMAGGWKVLTGVK
jgi:Uncharacterised nucleotidyltransferase